MIATRKQRGRPCALTIIGVLAAGGLLFFAARWVDRWLALCMEPKPPPADMVLVPAGAFVMGSNSPLAEPDERPARDVFLDAFYIDRFEVTNEQFAAVFPEHAYPAGEEGLPVTGVSRHQAQAFCKAVGKRLPTGAEWEKAARGTDGQIYPWGNTFRADLANVKPIGSRAVEESSAGRGPDACAALRGDKVRGGSFPGGVSPYGVHDMAGNVWEWVSDDYRDRSLLLLEIRPHTTGILRGGAYGYSAWQARSSYQGFEHPDVACNDTGFRCAMDAQPAN